MSIQFDPDRVRNRIKGSLEKLQNEVDPALLNRYRTLIKQEVSLFKRSYFAAYLLMEAEQRGGPENQNRGYRRYAGEGGRREPYPLSEEDSVRLFVGVGRSRRVFPREILGLILSRTDISRDDVGAIRILDNYSFVQVRNTVADTIIETINGAIFRGRPLLVNYARTRKDSYFPAGENPERDRPEEAPCTEDRPGDGGAESGPACTGEENPGDAVFDGAAGSGLAENSPEGAAGPDEGGFVEGGPEEAGEAEDYTKPPSAQDDYGEDQGDKESV
jgi:hypothetical protein